MKQRLQNRTPPSFRRVFARSYQLIGIYSKITGMKPSEVLKMMAKEKPLLKSPLRRNIKLGQLDVKAA